MAINGLPQIPSTALPAAVRNGSEADKQAYKAALGFEQMLVEQMVSTMAGDRGPLSEGPYAQQMQTTLASAITGAGGLGLAQQLYKDMTP